MPARTEANALARGHARGSQPVERRGTYATDGSRSALLEGLQVGLLGRRISLLGLGWVSAAFVCALSNIGLDLVAGPSFHWREYDVAERAAAAKVAVCWVGSALLVPGERSELRHARDDLAAIREEKADALLADTDSRPTR